MPSAEVILAAGQQWWLWVSRADTLEGVGAMARARRQAGRKRASSFYITPDNPRQGQGTSFYIIYQKSRDTNF